MHEKTHKQLKAFSKQLSVKCLSLLVENIQNLTWLLESGQITLDDLSGLNLSLKNVEINLINVLQSPNKFNKYALQNLLQSGFKFEVLIECHDPFTLYHLFMMSDFFSQNKERILRENPIYELKDLVSFNHQQLFSLPSFAAFRLTTKLAKDEQPSEVFNQIISDLTKKGLAVVYQNIIVEYSDHFFHLLFKGAIKVEDFQQLDVNQKYIAINLRNIFSFLDKFEEGTYLSDLIGLGFNIKKLMLTKHSGTVLIILSQAQLLKKFFALLPIEVHEIFVEMFLSYGQDFVEHILGILSAQSKLNKPECLETIIEFLLDNRPLAYQKMTRAVAAYQIIRMIENPSSIDTGDRNVCGPATGWLLLVQSDPEMVLSNTLSLLENGDSDCPFLKPTSASLATETDVVGAILVALKNSVLLLPYSETIRFWDYKNFVQYTEPKTMTKLLSMMGFVDTNEASILYNNEHSEMSLLHRGVLGGLYSHHHKYFKNAYDNFQAALIEFIHNKKIIMVLENNMAKFLIHDLQPSADASFLGIEIPHYVNVFDLSLDGDVVKLKIATWGEEVTKSLSLKKFLEGYRGFISTSYHNREFCSYNSYSCDNSSSS